MGGAVPDGRWGGQVLADPARAGKAGASIHGRVSADSVAFATWNADLRVGTGTVSVRRTGRYLVRARARGEKGEGDATVDLTVVASTGRVFPRRCAGRKRLRLGLRGGGFACGRRPERSACASAASGTTARRRYHDHNWGVWRGVTWEWGAARAGAYTFLYGRVQPPDSASGETPLFVYLVDSLGFRTLFRPRRIDYTDGRTIRVNGRELACRRAPCSRMLAATTRCASSSRSRTPLATDTSRPQAERGETIAARALARPYFIQMKGRARVSGRVDGVPISGAGSGFFETYR